MIIYRAVIFSTRISFEIFAHISLETIQFQSQVASSHLAALHWKKYTWFLLNCMPNIY